MAAPVSPSKPMGPQPVTTPSKGNWTKPAAMAIPKEGYFKLERGRYGPLYPRTPACHGFTLIAKIKPGREEAIRAHGKTIEKAVSDMPTLLRLSSSITFDGS